MRALDPTRADGYRARVVAGRDWAGPEWQRGSLSKEKKKWRRAAVGSGTRADSSNIDRNVDDEILSQNSGTFPDDDPAISGVMAVQEEGKEELTCTPTDRNLPVGGKLPSTLGSVEGGGGGGSWEWSYKARGLGNILPFAARRRREGGASRGDLN